MGFEDHFSHHAEDYAAHRPRYPEALFAHLISLAPGRERAWDCGTGNGQAAVGLAPHFREVIATDGSAAQIANALAHERVTYAVAPAEASGIDAGSVDLVTVAQAAHWFDLPCFYAEVNRVLKPRGVLAMWCYGLFRISPNIDPLLHRYYLDIVGPYWPAQRRFIDEQYQTLPFPFSATATPAFAMETQWDLDEVKAYMRTWSAAQRFQAAVGADALAAIEPALACAWGKATDKKRITWPVHLRAGRRV
jgi:SAM-dependent methyltransferase